MRRLVLATAFLLGTASLGLSQPQAVNPYGVKIGTAPGTVAAGNDSRITGALQAARNLSDLTNLSVARTSLGLGPLAILTGTQNLTINSGLLSLTGANVSAALGYTPVDPSTLVASATTDTTNASNITAGILSIARLPQATASTLGAAEAGTGLGVTQGIFSVLYGTTAGTAAQGNDARIIGALQANTAAATYAPLASPSFTGSPTAPSPSSHSNSTQIATTAWVTAALASANNVAETVNSSGGATTLAANDVARTIFLTGTLTSDASLIVPTTGAWTIINNTSGAHSYVVRTLLGSGVTVAQGKTAYVVTDGTNVLRADTDFSYGPTITAPAITNGTFYTPVLQTPTINTPSINSGTIDNTLIGGTTPNIGNFTVLTASGTVSGAGFTALLAPYATKTSPAFIGVPTAPTAPAGTSTTQIATTEFATNAVSAALSGGGGSGTINNTPIGTTTPAAGVFTTLSATNTASFIGTATFGASSGNQLQIIPQSTGVSPQIAAAGTDANIDVILFPKGTGVVRTNVGGIFRGSYLSVSGGTYAWSGNNAGEGKSGFFASEGLSGTTGTGTAAWNYIAINSDTTDASTAAGGLAAGFQLSQNFGGTAMKGGRVGFDAVLNLTATSGNTNGANYIGGSYLVQAAVPDNGVSGTPRSALVGINPQVILQTGALNWAGLDGAEFDLAAKSGTSVATEYGLAVVKVAGDVIVPSGQNAAITINNQYAPGGGAGWAIGIDFGKLAGNFPLPSTGTMIYGEQNGGAFTVANGIDWHLGTASGNWLQFGNVFTLTGAGKITATGIDATPIGATTPSTGAFTTATANTVTATTVTANGNGSTVGLIASGPAEFDTIATKSASSVLQFKNGPFGPGMLTIGGTNGDFAFSAPLRLFGGTWGTGNLAEGIAPIFQNTTFAGTTTNAAAGLGMFLQQSDSSSNVNGMVGVLEHLTYGGATAMGGREAGQFILDINAATGNTNGPEYVGFGIKCNLTATDGTPGHHASCFGENPVAYVGPNVTAAQLVGSEIDTWSATGAIITDRIGLQIVDVTGGTGYGVQSSRDDVALSLNNQYAPNTGLGYKVGFEFGRAGGNFPVAKDGTMMYAQANAGGAFTVSNGIDFHLGTATGTWLNLGGVFTVAGNGDLSAAGIDNTPIGATTPSTGKFTTLVVSGSVSGSGINSLLAGYAPLLSPAFTGSPTAPTVAHGDDSTAIATTSFVNAEILHGVITQGQIDGTPIGSTTPSTGAFTTLSANSISTNSLTIAALNNTPIGTTTAAAGVFTTLSAASLSTTGNGTIGGNLTVTGSFTTGGINNTPVGNTTPSTGVFTTLVATSLNSTSIGTTTPATGAFTTLSTTGNATIGGGLTVAALDNTPIGSTTPASGSFTTLASSGNTTVGGTLTATVINNTPIGTTQANTAKFTTVSASGTITANSWVGTGSNYFNGNTGFDASSFISDDLYLRSWWGIGFGTTSANQIYSGLNSIVFETRGGSATFYGNLTEQGTFLANGAKLSTTGTIATLDTGLYQAALSTGTPIAAGGSGVTTNDRFYDPYGDTYSVTASGGTVTAIIMQNTGIWRAGTPPANPIPLTAITGTGTGVQVNLSWTQAVTLSLNPTGGIVNVPGVFSAGTGLPNYWLLNGSSGDVGLNVTGSSTNINIKIGPKGNGVLYFNNSNGRLGQFSDGTGGNPVANSLQFSNAATGNPSYSQIQASGTDTNRGIWYRRAGTGQHLFDYVVAAPTFFVNQTMTYSGSNAGIASLTPQYSVYVSDNLKGAITSGSVTANLIAINDDTVNFSSSPGGGVSWLMINGNVGTTPWQPNHAYNVGDQVNNGGNIYKVTTAGTSAASGGPTGIGVTINDNDVVWAYQSADFSGNRAGIQANISIVAPNDPNTPNDGYRQWQSMIGTTTISANQGGTSLNNGATAGFTYGGADQMWAKSGATFLSGVVGRETDVGIWAGASSVQRTGMQVVAFGDNQGAEFDQAYKIGVNNSGASVNAWAPGFKVGLTSMPMAIDPSGAIIQYSPYWPGSLVGKGKPPIINHVTYGIDLYGYAVTQAAYRAEGGFSVDQTGAINIGAGLLKSTTTAVSLDVVGYEASLPSDTPTAGGTGYQSGETLWDQYGNGYTVGTVDGSGVIQTITLATPSGTTSTTMPSGAIALNGGTGINATVTPTWTRISTLDLNPSGGSTVVGGSLQATAINNTPIGSTTPSTGVFTTLTTSGTQTNLANGISYDGTANPNWSAKSYAEHFDIGTFNQDATYTGGASAELCIATTTAANGAGCYIGSIINNTASSYAGGILSFASQGINGATTLGGLFQATQLAGSTTGETQGLGIIINSNVEPTTTTSYTEGIEVESEGTYAAQSGIEFVNSSSTKTGVYPNGFLTAVLMNNCCKGNVAGYAYIGDANGAGSPSAGTTKNGIIWAATTFTSAEYDGPSFKIGATVASFNARIAILGSSGGSPTITAVGAGASPATNANVNLLPLGSGVVTAPTAALGTNTTQLATTAFVQATLAAPGVIGSITPNTGLFTTVTTSGPVAAGTFLIGSTATSISAAGTDQSSATALTAQYNDVTSVASGTGVVIPLQIGARISVYNDGTNPLLVYPPGTASIDNNASAIPISVTVGGSYHIVCLSSHVCHSD